MNADSLIFDMDGTLWDAVDSYARVWNATIHRLGINRHPVTRRDLLPLMGMPIYEILTHILPDLQMPAEHFLYALADDERALMPQYGGTLYLGVRETISELHHRGYRLFMVSNCGDAGLPNFLRFTGLEPYFEGTLSYGENGRDKAYNIAAVIRKYDLKSPVYIGDTQGDLDSTHAAGIPFIWASYGFGRAVTAPDAAIQSIKDLPALLK